MTKLITYSSYVLILIGIGIHLIVGIREPLFGDEIHSIFFANSYTYRELITKPIEIIHPNTYYILVKFLLQLGVDISGLRIFQWAIFSLTLFPVYGIFKKLKLAPNQALIGLVVWTWSAYLLRYSYMIRMYGMGIFLVALSLYFCLKNKFISQLVIDMVGINFVMGYWFFIAIKYTALFVKHKKQSLIALVIFTLLLLPTILGAMATQQQIASTYLYWVPIPKITDALPMATALLGLTSTAYFEGYTATSSSLPSVLLLVACFLVILYLYRQKSKSDLLSYLAGSCVVVYFLLFITGLVFKLPLFHIRQLFPIAIILTLFFTRAMLTLMHRQTFLLYVLIIPIVIFGMRKTISYAFGSAPIYPAHYQNKPAGPVYFTTADIEFAHNYCGATSFADLSSKCPVNDIHLFVPNTIFPATFTLTSSGSKLVDTTIIVCSPVSIDFQLCKKN